MTQMPNWFRWLIIVIATLIMCACRAPIQNGQPTPQSVLVNPQAYASPANAGIPEDLLYNNATQLDAGVHQSNTLAASNRAQAGSKTTDRNVALALAALNEPRAQQSRPNMTARPPAANTAQSRRAEQRSRIVDLLNGEPETKRTTVAAIRPPIAVAQRPAPTLTSPQPRRNSQGFAPVVKNTNAGVRIQEIQAMVPEKASAQTATKTELAAGQSASRAVYLRMNDEANESNSGQLTEVVATAAQLDAEVGSHLGTEYGAAEVVTPSAAPMAPIVSSEFANGVAAQNSMNDASSVLVPNTASSEIAPQALPNSTEWSGAPIVDSPNHMMSTGQPVNVAPYSQPNYGEPAHGQPVYGSPSYEQPLLADDAALSLDTAPQYYSSGPYEEYLPVEEVPVEVMPERWADDPYAAGQNIAERELSRRYPDEYICDGGDSNGQVFVMNDWRLRNLDPEDTIGHYDTKAGEVVVEASNRVCVYAPRFAAARQVTSPFQTEKHEQLLVAATGTKAFLEQIDSGTNQLDSTLSPQRHVLMQPPSSFRQKTAGVEGIQRRAVKIAAYDVSAHEDFRVMKLGVHKQSEKARLSEFTAKAVNWTSDKAVQILVDEEVAKTNVSRRGAETFFTVGDNGPAKLRVIKTASRSDALPGEEVEFTLRFDNVGFQTIGNVTVVDNLTTRLEFIDDSDLCSEECTFLTDDNDAESLTLRWEIRDPIKPGQGGLIRFRCRVR